jgi:hypothetical protein
LFTFLNEGLSVAITTSAELRAFSLLDDLTLLPMSNPQAISPMRDRFEAYLMQ